MTWKLFVISLALSALFLHFPVMGWAALPETCTKLTHKELARARALMAQVNPYDCCDDRLSVCLEKTAPSRLVTRLAGNLCLRVSMGQRDTEILKETQRHIASMMSAGPKAAIDETAILWAGDLAAPVKVLVYACARCAFCAKSVPEIYEAVVNGNLKGKAKLGLRVFVVKSHAGSREGGLAMAAAESLGLFWPYLLKLYSSFDAFSIDLLPLWAEALGASSDAFREAMNSPSVLEAVVASKKEGLAQQVEATPTYFINGKLYRGDMKHWALSSAILEEYEGISGNLCKPE